MDYEKLQEVCDGIVNVATQLMELADKLQAAVAIDEPEPTKTSQVQQPSLEDVRAVLAAKSRDGHTAEVRQLLQKFGASRLSAVKPELYADLLAKAEVIGDAK